MLDKEKQTLVAPKSEENYRKAIELGKEALSNGGNKADAARAILKSLMDEEREVIIRAFVEGATLTEKGAPTYFYNIMRRMRREEHKHKQSKLKTEVEKNTQEMNNGKAQMEKSSDTKTES